MRTWMTAAAISGFVLAAGLAGCSGSSSGPSGSTGDDGGSSGTSGDGGSSGTSGDGGSSGTSGAGGSSGTSGDGGSSGASGDGGKLPFGSACQTAAQCEGGACVNFPAKGGMYCTQTCTGATANTCPNNGLGCNGMGYCKIP